MIYAAQLARLDVGPDDDAEQVRAKFDSDLGVTEWRRGRGRITTRRDDVDPDAPYWWHGDEDASQSFLRGMGITLD